MMAGSRAILPITPTPGKVAHEFIKVESRYCSGIMEQ